MAVATERHEETILRIGVHGVVGPAPSYDMSTVERYGGIGIHGIVSRQHINRATVADDALLAFYTFRTGGRGPDGHTTAVDGDHSLRSDALCGSNIFVLAAEAAKATLVGAVVALRSHAAEVRHLTIEVREATAKVGHLAIETRKAREAAEACAVVAFRSHATEVGKREATTEVRHLSIEAGEAREAAETCAVAAFRSHATEIGKWEAASEVGHLTIEAWEAERLLAEVVARCCHVDGRTIYGDILLRLDTATAVAGGDDVQRALSREQQLVLCPDHRRLVVRRVVAGSDGQRVLRALGNHYLQLLLVLQP